MNRIVVDERSPDRHRDKLSQGTLSKDVKEDLKKVFLPLLKNISRCLIVTCLPAGMDEGQIYGLPSHQSTKQLLLPVRTAITIIQKIILVHPGGPIL